MKWKKILTGTLAAAMLFSNASVANLNVLAKETAVVSLESARETLGTLMNEAIEKVNIEKDGIKYSQASKDAVMVKYAAARKVKNSCGCYKFCEDSGTASASQNCLSGRNRISEWMDQQRRADGSL